MKRLLLFFLLSSFVLDQTYTTTFPVNENPISQGSLWINGATTGVDWGNVAVVTGTGGVQQATGTVLNGGPPFNDSTAVLSGTWAQNQSAQGVVHIANQQSAVQEEVEIRLRTTIISHSITGYEFDASVDNNAATYLVI